MNKKGTIVTVVSFKKYLLILVLLYIGYYFYIMWSSGFISLPTSCPKGIIPDRINIPNNQNMKCLRPTCPITIPCYLGYNDVTWADNTPMHYPVVYKGCNEGQNINYLYANDLVYERQPISSDGTIEKKISFKFDLVLDSRDKNESGYKVIDYKCKG